MIRIGHKETLSQFKTRLEEKVRAGSMPAALAFMAYEKACWIQQLREGKRHA